MSVRANQRRPSEIQYIDTARELVVHTLSYARKFPKSLTFLFTKDIVDCARKVYTEAMIANSCFPNKKEAVIFRYNHLMEAKGQLDALDGLLSIALEMFSNKLIENEKGKNISDFGWVHWGELIDKEKNLIKKVLASDSALTF